jgi:hypothetical protein
MDRLDDTALRSMLGTLCARALAKAPAGLGPHAKTQRKVSRKGFWRSEEEHSATRRSIEQSARWVTAQASFALVC